MQLELRRKWLSPKSSGGELYVDGAFECFTLEDRFRPPPEPKVPKETCIPEGAYSVVINHSDRFGIEMPLLVDVPQFQGIRIHPGNTPADTEGCILVGRQRDVDQVLNSRAAYDVLFQKLKAAVIRKEPITITVKVMR
jgi:hypothetical protein